ncbi:MAG: cytochrome c3 family protein [Proteobacteria bacterium]|nr:cytochrome c3 family protein [Pseudomonadota bacterium]
MRPGTFISAAVSLALALGGGLATASQPAQLNHGEAAEPLPPALAHLLDGAADPSAREYLLGLPAETLDSLEAAVESKSLVSRVHLSSLLEARLPAGRLQSLATDNCALCHGNPEYHESVTRLSKDPAAHDALPYMELGLVLQDQHFQAGLGCAACHGGDPAAFMDHDFVEQWPENREKRLSDRRWVPGFCGRCHSDAQAMADLGSKLPTGQVTDYKMSTHGQLLLDRGDSRAPECSSCHGSHTIRGAKSPSSPVNPAHVPDTCGACHSDADHMSGFELADGSPYPTSQQEQYTTSVHGRALLERGDLGVATCNDCHGSHLLTVGTRDGIGQACVDCHALNRELFQESTHRLAFEEHGWPECSTCHGSHAIEPAGEHMLSGNDTPCASCHPRFAADNPNCQPVAEHFLAALRGLSGELKRGQASIHHFAEMGVDVEPMELQLVSLEDSLRQARTQVHGFDRATFDGVVAPGLQAATELESARVDSTGELRIRRLGLGWTTLLTALLGLLIYLKLRRAEKSE